MLTNVFKMFILYLFYIYFTFILHLFYIYLILFNHLQSACKKHFLHIRFLFILDLF